MSDEYRAALSTALKKLEASDRFESEVRKALSRYAPETVEQVVAYLKEKRFLNDERSAATVVEINQGRRAVGTYRLRQKLSQRGASEETVAAAIAAAAEEEPARADAVLAGKFRDPKPEDRAKAGRFLYSRGFGVDVIEAALDRFFTSE